MLDTLLWEELEPIASEWDCVWNDTEKLKWAEQAWRFIVEADLAGFSSPLERARVVIRFLALAGMFSDFYEIAFSDGFKPDYLAMGKEVELTLFRLGQIVGSEPGLGEYDDDDLNSLLHTLAAHARTEVYPALVSGFGHVPSLFISLWKTNLSACASGDCDEHELDDCIVNCNLTPEKQQAYLWLTEGCEPWG